jgi:hypothetical protein
MIFNPAISIVVAMLRHEPEKWTGDRPYFYTKENIEPHITVFTGKARQEPYVEFGRQWQGKPKIMLGVFDALRIFHAVRRMERYRAKIEQREGFLKIKELFNVPSNGDASRS